MIPTSEVRYDFLVKNFVCPDFHTCTMVDSLKACEDYLSSGVKGVCQSVSTNFIEMTRKGFGRGSNMEPTGLVHPGPDKAMIMVHNELSEKVSQYVTENFTWLALAGLSALILTYGSYELIRQVKASPKYLETADKEQFAKLLQKATVSHGHWNGNQICFEGESEKATFSQVSARIEKIYSESVNFMRKRQATYEWSQEATRPPTVGKFSFFIGAPFMLAESLAKSLASAPPQLNVEEEQEVRDAMQWRQDRYAQLNGLFQQSQNQMNENSSNLGKLWNKTLDKLSSWKEVPLKRDFEILDQMIRNREGI